MTPCIGQTYTTTPIHNIRNVFHQTPNRHYHWPVTCHAVWRMARLENRRRARQAAIPPWVSASSLRTKDTRMRLLIIRKDVCSFTEREPPERKHLSRGRKRNQHGIPLVAASEMGTVQTESRRETCGRCRVKGLASSSLVKLKWPEKACHRG